MLEQMVTSVYSSLADGAQRARRLLGRPLTLAEKILFGHLDGFSSGRQAWAAPQRRRTSVALRPDRVAMQDATAQMALLQFMHAGRERAAVPSTVHCDHLIEARRGAGDDLQEARAKNDEVYLFLKTAAARYGIGFWEPGSGIIHQVVLENYAFPGGMMIGTDSHTPNAGGLGMVAVGVGGADAVDVMAGEPFGLRWPGLIGVHLRGKLSGWTSAKDVILAVMGELTVKGGTGHIVEFFGAGTASISCTGKATICNMGAEHGATTSVFPYDQRMAVYLRRTERGAIADLADAHAELLQADPEVLAAPERYFDRIVEIDLSTLEPLVVGPHTPDRVRPLSALAAEVRGAGFPNKLAYALIGSCTNSSYEDIGRAAHVARQAQAAGLKVKTELMVTPGSDKILHTIERDGQMQALTDVGATVLANACGPCIGQWRRTDIKPHETNSIITSYNRNFRGRNDGNAETLAFITSPEVVTAFAFAGELTFNPLSDSLPQANGQPFTFVAPEADELPPKGFAAGLSGFSAPPQQGATVEVAIAPNSNRLAPLARFEPWDGNDFVDLLVLLKAQGKCTTDHISPAGAWLRFRGHLDKISDNMFVGAVNAFSGAVGKGRHVLTGATDVAFPALARDYKARGRGWVVVGDENYGEGSSREHAAMSPRYLGARAVIVRSFARIHETNLKKQGVLPLTFVDPADYDKVREDDRVAIRGLAALAPERELIVELSHQDGTVERVRVQHTLDDEQIAWFKAGSALNRIAAKG